LSLEGPARAGCIPFSGRAQPYGKRKTVSDPERL